MLTQVPDAIWHHRATMSHSLKYSVPMGQCFIKMGHYSNIAYHVKHKNHKYKKLIITLNAKKKKKKKKQHGTPTQEGGWRTGYLLWAFKENCGNKLLLMACCHSFFKMLIIETHPLSQQMLTKIYDVIWHQQAIRSKSMCHWSNPSILSPFTDMD